MKGYPHKTVDLFCLILALIAICVALASLSDSKKVAAAFTSGGEMREVSEIARAHQAGLIEHTRQTLGLISNMHLDKENCDQDLEDLLAKQEGYINFGIADSTGQIICSGIPNHIKGNVSDREYFKRALESNRFAVGEYQINRVTSAPSINWAYPFESSTDGSAYVGIAVLSLEWLKRVVDEADLPPGSELSIVDNKGVVLARYSDKEVGGPATELSYNMESVMQAARELAILKMRDGKGTTRYVAVAPVGIPEQEGFLHILLSVPVQRVLPVGLGSVITAFE
ncbi:MAG TPA: cache domain-containing protein [Candidatus Paceibacterota bacterium]|jgi:hypothetical protein